jgi:hypothetical protein
MDTPLKILYEIVIGIAVKKNIDKLPFVVIIPFALRFFKHPFARILWTILGI